MKVHDIYAGFTVERVQPIQEVNSVVYELKHNQSGARLIYMENDDTNKVFSISFRTTPTDSTGVAHITEHSVLCGSRKFPLKEPFVELVKGSLNTFLNAMTYPDKTMYPVASKNDKDFHNLMDVYLDAVFFPRVANDPEIIMQEGWHYELNNMDEPLTYKGVVFNEMKGVYSSPDAVLERQQMAMLFPDTTYGVDSGGDPDHITDLTFNGFQEFYQTHYHPSNSYIFLYGKMDIEEQLRFIDREYLSQFHAIDVSHTEVTYQASLAPQQGAFPYGIGSDESEDNKSIHALTYVMPPMSDSERLAFDVLTYALLNSPAAPLKQALIKAGVGSEVSGYFLDSVLQPMWNVSISASNKEQQEQFGQLVIDTLQDMCDAGLDKTLLTAALNTTEFILRENDFGGRPIGLAYGIRIMDNWLYGKDPFQALQYEDSLREIRKGLEGDYFEQLLSKAILQNGHRALVSVYPQKGLQEEKDEQVAAYLANVKSQMSTEELEGIMAATKALAIRQETPDTEEALATIPLLSLDDLSPQVEEVERREQMIDAGRLHFIPAFTKGINYVSFYFGLDCLSEDELFYADLLSDMFARLSTSTMSYEELGKAINMHMGGLTSDVTSINISGERDAFVPLFIVRGKGLHSELGTMVRLMNTVITDSQYMDPERLLELVKENKAVWDNEVFRRGHTIATQRALATVSPANQFRHMGNLGYYEQISSLVNNEVAMSELPQRLQAVAAKIFRANNVDIMLVGDETDVTPFVEYMTPVVASWSHEELPNDVLHMTLQPSNEGIATASQIQFVAQGGNFRDHGGKYVGAMSVLETILRYEYLWIRVRVQGGAYGAFANFYNDGTMAFCSYRDPNLTNTLDVYKELPAFLRELTLTEREMRKYIIGTMSTLDTPLTPALRGPRAMSQYFSKGTTAKKVAFRQQVIDCTVEDLQALAPIVEGVLQDNHIAVFGNEQLLKEHSQLFDDIKALPQ